MRKNLGIKPYILPMPVLIIGTYDKDGKANAMNAAWGTVCDMDKVSIYLAGEHKTVKNLLQTKAFTVSIADKNNVVSADYVGIVSGNKEPDKVQKAGWTVIKSQLVNAPLFKELPLTLECKLISFDSESENCIGEIVGISADNSILDDKGNVDYTLFNPISYDPIHHGYYQLGERVGKAFKDGKGIK